MSKATSVGSPSGSSHQQSSSKYTSHTTKALGHASIVILGASGDLAKRKLYPALFSLFKDGLLPNSWNIVGYARSELEKEELVKRIQPFVLKQDAKEAEQKKYQEFLQNLYYVSGQYDQIADFEKLNSTLTGLEEGKEKVNRLFFLSLPPDVFLQSAKGIGNTCRTKKGWNRIVVEKPFGRDLETFEELSKGLNSVFDQHEIYRIDHYIGKEVVQNLLVLRFANVIFDPLWNRSNIKCVQIFFKEQLGVEGRGGYFDNYGIIRDVMQNHMMQILTLMAMEPPVSLTPEDISMEKIKVLKSIPEIKIDDLVVGQYKSKTISGKEYPGYRDDPTVNPSSNTPTFAAVVCRIKNRRWDGVPILMKCGKALDDKVAEIRIQFNDVPANLYSSAKNATPNELVIRIQPDEAIYFKIMNKVVGYGERLAESQLDFTYKSKYSAEIPDAYARLLLDVLEGNSSNFINEEELRISWKIWTPVLQLLEKNNVSPEYYAFGSRGPVEADYLAARYNVKWSEDK